MLIATEDIQTRVNELGVQITKDYKDKNLVIISVLTGALVFTADLIRCIDLPLRLDTIRARSRGKNFVPKEEVLVSGHANLFHIRDHHVLVTEDIADTGLTIEKVTKTLLQYNPASVQVATLLIKSETFRGQRPAYIGFEVEPDKFAYGYGLRDAEQFKRNNPYVKTIPSNMIGGKK